MKRKILSVAIIFTLGFGTIISGSVAEASSLSTLKEKKKEINKKSNSIESEIKQTSDKLREVKTKQTTIKDEVQRIDTEIQNAFAEIEKKNKEIADKDKEITALNTEIKETEERIKKRDELLMDRARAIQANGGTISYLDVLLGATSFTDFISRVSALSTILEADKAIIEEQKKDRESLEEKKTLVEKDREKLASLKVELQNQKASLESKKVEKNKLLDQLKEEQGAIEEYFMDLQEQQELIAAQEVAIKKAMELEQKRIAEEKRRQAEEAKRQQQQGSSGSSNTHTSSPVVSSGNFTRPATGRVTSEFGGRWGKHHNGIDIGATTRGVPGDPIYAAASGVVSKSYRSSSYGNVIFITHVINGQVYTTVYAHLSSRSAQTGQVVNKGDYIGAMGTTGRSTGVHLHFELHEGSWNNAKSNAVNPRKYINF